MSKIEVGQCKDCKHFVRINRIRGLCQNEHCPVHHSGMQICATFGCVMHDPLATKLN